LKFIHPLLFIGYSVLQDLWAYEGTSSLEIQQKIEQISSNREDLIMQPKAVDYSRAGQGLWGCHTLYKQRITPNIYPLKTAFTTDGGHLGCCAV
jgi:hypothetical protein